MTFARTAALVAAGIALAQGASAQEPARFTVRVENRSRGEALELSNGKTAPFVSAPALWVVHTTSTNPIFEAGKPDAGLGLEQLAETGNPSRLAGALKSRPGIVQVGADASPLGAKADGPLTPGQAYEFEITARPGEALSVAWMFGQSNDLFYAPGPDAIALFDAKGNPRTLDITSQLALWDAGTEVNEEPGLGATQAPRQPAPNTGPAERGTVRLVSDRFTYPKTTDVLRVTITARPVSVTTK